MTISAAASLGACVQQPAAEPPAPEPAADIAASAPASKVKLAPPITTVKPGASVTFSHDPVSSIAVGENGSVTLTVNEGYPEGVLHLDTSGDEGLAVFGPQTSARMDMAAGTSHTWRLDYAAERDGVYYINVSARAEMADGYSESRAYAVRVQVGDWQGAQAKVQAASDVQMLPTGEAAVILQAEETVD